MGEFSNESRKPVSLKTITNRMERVLIEFETRTNAHPNDEEEELEAVLANYQMPYTTEKGLDNQPEILDFAVQATRDEADIEQRARPRSRSKKIGPASRRNGSNNRNIKTTSSSERYSPRKRGSDAENEAAARSPVKKTARKRRAASRANKQKTQ